MTTPTAFDQLKTVSEMLEAKATVHAEAYHAAVADEVARQREQLSGPEWTSVVLRETCRDYHLKPAANTKAEMILVLAHHTAKLTTPDDELETAKRIRGIAWRLYDIAQTEPRRDRTREVFFEKLASRDRQLTWDETNGWANVVAAETAADHWHRVARRIVTSIMDTASIDSSVILDAVEGELFYAASIHPDMSSGVGSRAHGTFCELGRYEFRNRAVDLVKALRANPMGRVEFPVELPIQSAAVA